MRNFVFDRRAYWVFAIGAALLGACVGAYWSFAEHDAKKAAAQMHRAVYDLSVVRTKTGSEVQDVAGRMVVEWRGGPACDGYSSEQRVVTRVTDGEGNITTDDVRISSWESLDSNEFHFERTEYVNGQIDSKDSGVATRSVDGNQVTLEEEGKEPQTLPGDALFPTAYNNALTRAAKQGKHVFSAQLFDGTDENVTTATAFIGKLSPASPDAMHVNIKNVSVGKPLQGERAWPIQMSYFEDTSEEADKTPSFQMGFQLFPNGVSSALTLDYDDVVLKGDLVDIEYFKPGSC